MKPGHWYAMLKAVASKWQRDDCLNIGASLAYYALFSLFPLLLIILSIVGAIVNPAAFDVQQRLVQLVGSAELRELLMQTLSNLRETRGQAGLIGFATLLVAASGMFGALDRAFDKIWEVRPAEKRSLLATMRAFLVQRLIAFALIFGCVLLMLLSLSSTVMVTTLSNYTDWLPGQGLLLQSLQFIVTLALLSLAFGGLYMILPGRLTRWSDVWLGAIVAALLFTALQKLIGIFLSRSNYGSYGVVGSVMALLVWIYLTSQVVLLGAEISYGYAVQFGSMEGRSPEARGER